MDAVQDVKAKLDIEDVISEYVQLKRAGRNFKGLSPFTAEKSPSFIVSPDKNIWHDFSSGKGGDIFTFVMEMEGLDFRGALELLARRAGIDLEQYNTKSSGTSSKLKERLHAALEAATKFYQVQFSRNQVALEYVLKKRAFTKQTALDFRLGYSPNNGAALIDYLKKQKFTEAELEKAGLTATRYNGVSDMFRGRLMVPLMDPQGRVIGFTARLLVDDPKAPKYINTPQTILYDKSRHIFGLNFAKDAIRKSAVAVLVEGNLDVIASYQANVRNVVATAGTALTEMNLKAIKRFTGDVRLAFDQDRAGLAATERALPIAGKVGVSLSVITIPEGKDPDDLIKKNPKLWQEAINNHQYAVDWIIDRYKSQLDISSALGKREFSDVVLATIRRLSDAVEQEHYLQRLSQIIDVSVEALKTKLDANEETLKPRKKPKTTYQLSVQDIEHARTQNQLLSLLLMKPALRSHLKSFYEDMFHTEIAKLVFKTINEQKNDVSSKEMTDALLAHPGSANSETFVQDMSNYVKMLLLQHETTYQDLDDVELDYEIERVRTRLLKQYVETKKTELRRLHESGEVDEARLLQDSSVLDKLLKSS